MPYIETGPVFTTKQEIETRKYLFFRKPPKLFVAASSEGHVQLLRASGREKEEVVIAGRITVIGPQTKIDADGSLDLQIPTKNPNPVVKYVRGLPKIKPENVVPYALRP